MDTFRLDDWLVRPEDNTISRGATCRSIEPRVMDLLAYLARHPGEVVSHDRLIRDVWPHRYVGDGALQTAVSALRKAFGDDPRAPRILETVPKRGYRLIAASTAAVPVIAVLPFRDLTIVPRQDFLSAGMTDTLIAELGRHRSLRVISRHSVVALFRSDLPLPALARALGASLVVDGSVLLNGSRISITVQLVDAEADVHVWSDTFDAEVTNLFALQRDIAGAIAGAAGGGIEPDGSGPARGVHPDAVIEYLRGRFHWNKLDPAHFPRALEYFDKAIAIDPRFGDAYAGVADVWGAYGYWGMQPPDAVRDKVQAALYMAERVAPDNAEVSTLAGAFHFHLEYDWDAARRHLQRAAALNPNLAHARFLHALVLATLRDPQAFDEVERARRLDPLNPACLFVSALCHCGTDDLDTALEAIEAIFEIEPGFPPAVELRAEIRWALGHAGAWSDERRVWQADPPLAELFGDNAAGGDAATALKTAAARLEQRAGHEYVAPRRIARLYGLAGETDTALQIVRAAVEAHALMQIDYLQLTPAFAAVRLHPDFATLAERIDLPADGTPSVS